MLGPDLLLAADLPGLDGLSVLSDILAAVKATLEGVSGAPTVVSRETDAFHPRDSASLPFASSARRKPSPASSVPPPSGGGCLAGTTRSSLPAADLLPTVDATIPTTIPARAAVAPGPA